MKLATSLSSRFSPKRIFRSKSKSPSSVTRSDNNPSSFSSNASSSSSDESYHNLKPINPSSTPTSILPPSDTDFYAELIQAFKLLDRDDDGIVSRTDLVKLLTKLSPQPPSQEEVTLMLGEIDGGVISVEELASRVAAAETESGASGSEEMKEVFEYFDADRDGRISAEELHRVFGVIGDEGCTLEECRRMIATVDKSGDGFVCFDDFLRMMSPLNHE